MANRQDSGSNSAHENQRPTSHNEDALPEMTESGNRGDDQVRGSADNEDDEFEDTEDLDETEGSDSEEDDI
jgi:hypothetical protein